MLLHTSDNSKDPFMDVCWKKNEVTRFFNWISLVKRKSTFYMKAIEIDLINGFYYFYCAI